MTEILDDKRRAYASAANTLLGSEAFKEAAGAVEEALSHQWKTAGDAQSREAVFHKYDGLRAIIADLRKASADWQMHLEATKES